MKKFSTMLVLAVALTLNAIAPTYAGAVGGSKYGEYTIPPFSTHTFQIAFRGGEYARVAVQGDGSADLGLYIYDQWGRQVDSDDDDSAFCVSQWYVAGSAVYTIKIANHSAHSSRYAIATN